MEVFVRNGNVDQAMKILKKKLIRESTFKELSKRRYFSKPSVRKRVKREEAEKRRIKDAKKANKSDNEDYLRI